MMSKIVASDTLEIGHSCIEKYANHISLGLMFDAPLALLSWLGRQGTRAVAAIVVIGIAVPWIGAILKYVGDLRRGLNVDIGRKDFLEMTANHLVRKSCVRE